MHAKWFLSWLVIIPGTHHFNSTIFLKPLVYSSSEYKSCTNLSFVLFVANESGMLNMKIKNVCCFYCRRFCIVVGLLVSICTSRYDSSQFYVIMAWIKQSTLKTKWQCASLLSKLLGDIQHKLHLKADDVPHIENEWYVFFSFSEDAPLKSFINHPHPKILPNQTRIIYFLIGWLKRLTSVSVNIHHHICVKYHFVMWPTSFWWYKCQVVWNVAWHCGIDSLLEDPSGSTDSAK